MTSGSGDGGDRRRLGVFVSSNLAELGPERASARTAIRSLRLLPVMPEMDAGVTASPDAARRTAKGADVFVGIYWQSYGWVAPGEVVSAIEAEYRLAESRPRLAYVKEPGPDRDPRLAQLLDRITAETGGPLRTFESPGELAELLLDDLAQLLTSRFQGSAADSDLPSGTLTFLFADLEGSTRLIQRLGDGYTPVLGRLRAILNRATRAHHGYVVDNDGDRTFAVFESPEEGLEGAIQAQREIVAAPWPEGIAVRARMGLHTGVGTVTQDGYVGLDVHRAARVGAAGHGGQVLVSESVRQLTERRAGARGWRLRELGSFALRGLARTEVLYQVEAEGLEMEFPPPRARGASHVRLPTRLTTLVGREREIADIAGLISADSRLVTLTGAGGIGKSRLALAAAERITSRFPDGVFFVDLAPVDDRERVLDAVATACDVSAEAGALPALVEAFSHRQVLLVLDNFEHVVSAAPQVAALVGRCPGVHVLVTSRTLLRVGGEREYAVEPLDLPPTDCPEDDAIMSPAVQLFEQRARAVRPTFALTPKTTPIVADIARRLDGLPLAIELAAARLRMLTVEDLAMLLDRSLAALADTAGDRPPRHRTLRATIDWSYRLLRDDERQLLRALCSFAGGFSLEAAEAVWGGADAVDLLGSLVDGSLVIPADRDGRFRLLATVREFGLEAMAVEGEEEGARDRHAAYFIALAERLSPHLSDREQKSTIERLAPEWDNLRSAAELLAATADCPRLVRLVHALWPFIWLTNRVRQAHLWLGGGCRHPGHLGDELQGRLLWLLGGIRFELGEYDDAWGYIEQSIPMLEEAGDQRVLAWAHFLRGLLLPAFDTSPEAVRAELDAAITRFGVVGDRWGEGYALLTYQLLAATGGDDAEAAAYHGRCRGVASELGNLDLLAQSETAWAFALIALGRPDEAREALASAAGIFQVRTNHEALAYVLEGLAALALGEGRVPEAMMAFGAAEQLRATFGVRPWPAARPFFDLLAVAAEGLTDSGAAAGRQAGREMSASEAAATVLRRLEMIPA